MLAVDICWTYADICCCLEDGGATTKSRPQSSYLTIFETYKDVVREKKWTHARYYLRPGTASKLGSRAPAQAVPLRTLGFNSCFFSTPLRLMTRLRPDCAFQGLTRRCVARCSKYLHFFLIITEFRVKLAPTTHPCCFASSNFMGKIKIHVVMYVCITSSQAY